jgi:hypothetical protein
MEQLMCALLLDTRYFWIEVVYIKMPILLHLHKWPMKNPIVFQGHGSAA